MLVTFEFELIIEAGIWTYEVLNRLLITPKCMYVVDQFLLSTIVTTTFTIKPNMIIPITNNA